MVGKDVPCDQHKQSTRRFETTDEEKYDIEIIVFFRHKQAT